MFFGICYISSSGDLRGLPFSTHQFIQFFQYEIPLFQNYPRCSAVEAIIQAPPKKASPWLTLENPIGSYHFKTTVYQIYPIYYHHKILTIFWLIFRSQDMSFNGSVTCILTIGSITNIQNNNRPSIIFHLYRNNLLWLNSPTIQIHL